MEPGGVTAQDVPWLEPHKLQTCMESFLWPTCHLSNFLSPSQEANPPTQPELKGNNKQGSSSTGTYLAPTAYGPPCNHTPGTQKPRRPWDCPSGAISFVGAIDGHRKRWVFLLIMNSLMYYGWKRSFQQTHHFSPWTCNHFTVSLLS